MSINCKSIVQVNQASFGFYEFQQILMSISKDLNSPKLESFKKDQPETTAKREPLDRASSCEIPKKKQKHVRINLDNQQSHQKRTKSERSANLLPKDHRKPSRDYAKRLLTQQYRQASCRRYGNASQCKSKIERLRNQVVNDSLRKLEKKQQQDRRQIKQAHLQELYELDQFYSSVVMLHKERSNGLFAQWEKKQRKDIRRLEKSLSKSRKVNCSAEIIMLNDIEQMLVEKELYPEADRVRRETIEAQKNFSSAAENDLKQKERQLKINLWQQHRKEYQVLLDRIEHSSEQRALRYKKQRQKLQQHYENVLSQLTRHHFLEIQKLNKSAHMLQRFMNNSRNNVRWIIQSQQL